MYEGPAPVHPGAGPSRVRRGEEVAKLPDKDVPARVVSHC